MLIRRTPSVLDRFFEDWNRPLSEYTNNGNALALDIHENDKAYIVTTDVPGVNSDDIDIRLHDNVLTINAETHREHRHEDDNMLVQERYAGRMSRSVRLPQPVNSDDVEASYENGVLTVHIAKADNVKPRRITVRAGNPRNN
jgi:HSP20 family protein